MAMKKIQEVKSKREERFYNLRMKNAAAKSKEKETIKMDIAKNINLIKPDVALAKEQVNTLTPNKVASTTSKKSAAAR